MGSQVVSHTPCQKTREWKQVDGNLLAVSNHAETKMRGVLLVLTVAVNLDAKLRHLILSRAYHVQHICRPPCCTMAVARHQDESETRTQPPSMLLLTCSVTQSLTESVM